MIQLAPSILSADFSNLSDEIRLLEDNGVEYIHIDIMDGHFVNNTTMGLPIVSNVRSLTNLTLDVHLMISNPEVYIEDFAATGADIINVHKEACVSDISAVLRKIKGLGKKAAITIKPETDYKSVLGYLGEADMVLIMSVDPGFGGQALIPSMLNKAYNLADYISKNNLKIDIEMDGGINLSNITEVLNAGVNIVVVGSYIFDARNKSEVLLNLRNAIEGFEKKYAGTGFFRY